MKTSQTQTLPSLRPAARRGALAFAALFALASLAGCPSGDKAPPALEVYEGDLVGKRGRQYAYVNGDILDSRNISAEYLVGDVRGTKSRGIWIGVMRGNVEQGAVTVNVLHGNIINGDNVTVNVLIGEDFSGKAKVARKLNPPDAE